MKGESAGWLLRGWLWIVDKSRIVPQGADGSGMACGLIDFVYRYEQWL